MSCMSTCQSITHNILRDVWHPSTPVIRGTVHVCNYVRVRVYIHDIHTYMYTCIHMYVCTLCMYVSIVRFQSGIFGLYNSNSNN